MRRCASVAPFGSTFDKFLFAPVSDDENGMPLSVLSALARLGLDPWQEAASLARLPGTGATQRLASLIGALPDRPPSPISPWTVAAGLVPLLPHAVNSTRPPSGPPIGANPAGRILGVVIAGLCLAIWVFMLGSQFITASREPPAQGRGSSSNSPPAAPPETSNQ